MIRNLSRIVCFLLLAALVQAAQPVRILFIGNSFTFVNNLPEVFTKLAAAGGVEVQTQLVGVGGSTLNGHLGRGDAQKAIHNGHWDRELDGQHSHREWRAASGGPVGHVAGSARIG
jgi:hypothetical protein